MITKRQLTTVLLNGNPVLYREKETNDRETLDSLKKAGDMLHLEFRSNRKNHTNKKCFDKEISDRQEHLAIQAVKSACKKDFQSALLEIVNCISDCEDRQTYAGKLTDRLSDYENYKTYASKLSDGKNVELSKSETAFLHLLITSVCNIASQAVALDALAAVISQRE